MSSVPDSNWPGNVLATRPGWSSFSISASRAAAASAASAPPPLAAFRASLRRACVAAAASKRAVSSSVSGTNGGTVAAPDPSLLRATKVKTAESATAPEPACRSSATISSDERPAHARLPTSA